MSNTCKAAVWVKRNQIDVMDVQMPVCADDGMIIKVEAASVCGTDLHLFKDDPRVPMILGHEVCGTVVEMGKDAAKSMRCYTGKVKTGDRICLYPWVVCGTCSNCLTYGNGACGVCENAFVYGVPFEALGVGGSPVRSNSVHEAPYIKGGFAEYMYIFPGTYIWQLPEEMPSNVASLLDPMAVAMRSVELAMRAPGIFEDSFNLGSTVLVIGDGQIAALTATIARTLGVQHVIISGFSDEKLARAQKMSKADRVMNALKMTIEERKAVIAEYTKGRGADVVFQCAGSPKAFRDGIDLLKNVGTLIETGNIVCSQTVEFNPARDLCSKHATYIGMSINTANAFNKAFQMLCKYKQIGLEQIFTHRCTLETLGETMQKGMDQNYMKAWVDFSK